MKGDYNKDMDKHNTPRPTNATGRRTTLRKLAAGCTHAQVITMGSYSVCTRCEKVLG